MSRRVIFPKNKCAGGVLPIRAKKKFKSGYNEVWVDFEFKYPSISGRKYKVSNLGRLASYLEDINKDGVILSPSPSKNSAVPYLIAQMDTFKVVEVEGKKGKIRLSDTKYLHYIVAEKFVHNDDPKNKKFVIHIDCDITNNQASNLRWATREEYKKAMRANNDPRIKIKKYYIGSKLTLHQARKLKTLVLEGRLKKSTLAKMFGINLTMVYKVEYGTFLKDIEPYSEADPDPTTKKPISE